MGKTKPHLPVKLIAAITITATELWKDVKNKLELLYSPIDCAMDWYDFTHTDYYKPEMGENLIKRMVAFEKLISAEILSQIKLTTNDLEDRYAIEGKRQVNIDPGYICPPKLVLATTKDFAHRIYLDKGIFGDIHLKYVKQHFQPQEWTYPDYKEPAVLRFFEKVREIHLLQLGGLAS